MCFCFLYLTFVGVFARPWKEKITILVTHQLQHLEDASHILVLNYVSNF